MTKSTIKNINEKSKEYEDRRVLNTYVVLLGSQVPLRENTEEKPQYCLFCIPSILYFDLFNIF